MVCSVVLLGDKILKVNIFTFRNPFEINDPDEEGQHTGAFCISVVTRIVELLQQIGTQLIQRLDLFLFMNI